MLLNSERSLISRLRSLPAKRIRAFMMAMALIVASAQFAIVVHHSTELQPEPPGQVCPICLVGSGLVGMHASPPILATPPVVAIGTIQLQPESFYSFRSYIYHARDPPAV